MPLPGKKAIVSVLIIVLISAQGMLNAQIRTNSPYTRFGIGNLNRNPNPRFLAMGGLSLGLRDPEYVNLWNPASYTAFDSLSFIFEGGVIDHYVELKTSDKNSASNYASLSHLTTGFPVTKWWRSSIGLVPVSDVGYIITLNDDVQDVSPVAYKFDGSGGINQLYWGNGFRLAKNLSVGFNMSYFFGSITHNRSVYLPDTAYYYNVKISDITYVNDIYFTTGLQYHKTFTGERFFTAGLVFNAETQVDAKNDYLAQTFLAGQNDVEYIIDTVSFREGEPVSITWPWRIGIGLATGKAGKWLAGTDFQYQNWESFTYNGQADSLKNSITLAVGGEFIPDAAASGGYWKNIHYRLGARYQQSQLELRNHRIDEFGISFGFGFPLKRSRSTINLGAEFGSRGTTADNLIQENYITFSFGISAFERWFFKTRYN
jgi:hypothetical protein